MDYFLGRLFPQMHSIQVSLLNLCAVCDQTGLDSCEPEFV